MTQLDAGVYEGWTVFPGKAERLGARRKEAEKLQAESMESEKRTLERKAQRASKAKDRWMMGTAEALGRAAELQDKAPSESKNSGPFKVVPNEISNWLKVHGKPSKPELTPQQRLELRECFNLIDTDAGGTLTIEEILSAFKYMGVRMSVEMVTKTLFDLDGDGSGEIEFDEFVKLMTETLAENEKEDDDVTKEPTIPPVPFPLLATSFRRRKLLNAMVSDDIELRTRMIEVKRRSELQFEKEAEREARREQIRRRAQFAKPSLRESQLGEDPNAHIFANTSLAAPTPPARPPPTPRSRAAKSGSTSSLHRFIPARPPKQPYSPRWGTPAARPDTDNHSGTIPGTSTGRAPYTKALEMACIGHIREHRFQRELITSDAWGAYAPAAAAPRSKPPLVPSLKGKLPQALGAHNNENVKSWLSQISPRMHPPKCPSLRISPRTSASPRRAMAMLSNNAASAHERTRSAPSSVWQMTGGNVGLSLGDGLLTNRSLTSAGSMMGGAMPSHRSMQSAPSGTTGGW